MTSWNIVVCSDIQPKPIVIDVPDPAKWTARGTARDLISEAGKKLGYPEEQLTLYNNEAVLPEGKPLTECAEGLKNGVALLATIKPSTVHVFCPHIDATLRIYIPRREWRTWTVATLRTVVCFKLGIDPASSQNDILALKGESLCDSSKVCETDGKESLLTYTRIQQFQLPLPIDQTKHVFAAPSNVTKKFASSDTVYDRDVSAVVPLTQPLRVPSYPEWLTFWTITVQQLDGTKTSIKLPDINRTPIYKLRELVKEALSIPTHHQKLTLGGGSNNTIVLEDWDEEGGAMAIAHYPSLHDGATLYLVQLTKGIHVKVAGIKQQETYCRDLSISILLPNYINIHSPGKLSLKNLLSIIWKLCNIYSSRVYCQSTGSEVDCYLDAPVVSVKWIVDGCTLTMTKPQLK